MGGVGLTGANTMGGFMDLRRELAAHFARKVSGPGFYSRLGDLQEPVAELTPKEQVKWAKKLGLKYGDLVICCGVEYEFMCVGGIDAGNPWIYACKRKQKGGVFDEPWRLCVWRKVRKDGSLDRREPEGIMREYDRCQDTESGRYSGPKAN